MANRHKGEAEMVKTGTPIRVFGRHPRVREASACSGGILRVREASSCSRGIRVFGRATVPRSHELPIDVTGLGGVKMNDGAGYE